MAREHRDKGICDYCGRPIQFGEKRVSVGTNNKRPAHSRCDHR